MFDTFGAKRSSHPIQGTANISILQFSDLLVFRCLQHVNVLSRCRRGINSKLWHRKRNVSPSTQIEKKHTGNLCIRLVLLMREVPMPKAGFSWNLAFVLTLYHHLRSSIAQILARFLKSQASTARACQASPQAKNSANKYFSEGPSPSTSQATKWLSASRIDDWKTQNACFLHTFCNHP